MVLGAFLGKIDELGPHPVPLGIDTFRWDNIKPEGITLIKAAFGIFPEGVTLNSTKATR